MLLFSVFGLIGGLAVRHLSNDRFYRNVAGVVCAGCLVLLIVSLL